MKCGYPLSISGRIVPCGQCMPCRINKKRLWVGKMLLEAAHAASESVFVTLTYNDDHYPKDLSVSPDEVLDYINRLRKTIGHTRYFAVGEYGEITKRAHYHLALFSCPLHNEKALTDAWQAKGFVHIGLLEPKSAAYIAGYCTKKMTNSNDDRLDGRFPEFARMSRRPPLGTAGIRHIQDMLTTRQGAAAVASLQDVPSSFRMFGKEYPISRYFRDQLRETLGIQEPPVFSEWTIDYEQETQRQEKARQVAVKLWHRRKKDARVL